MVLIQSAQRCQRDIVKWRSKLAGSEREQVKSLFVKSKGHRIKSPANQQVVDILPGVGDAEMPVDFAREADHGAGLARPPWQTGNPSAKPPGSNRLR